MSKVMFKYSKQLGNRKIGEEVEMFESTANALKDHGKITKKIKTVKKEAKESKDAE